MMGCVREGVRAARDQPAQIDCRRAPSPGGRWLPLILFVCLSLVARAQSILPNGDFEQADPAHPGKPLHWDLPDGLGVRWTDAPSLPGASAHGKAIRMDTSVSEIDMVASYQKAGLTQWVFPKPQPNAIAETYGLSLYSDAVPAVPGKNYRISFDYMSEKGTGGFILLRGYANVNGQKKRVYEKKIECDSKGAWKTFNDIAHLGRSPQPVAEFKMMLFAYYPPGVAWWDNVKVEAIDEGGN
jgi:hypothetical protein